MSTQGLPAAGDPVPRARRLKVAFTHVRLGWGGSEKRVLWGIQALKDEYDVTLITAGTFDLAALNAYYGTSLRAEDFDVVQVPLPPFLRRSARAAAWRGAWFQRWCRKLAPRFDVHIGGYGPTDFGVPALHFIADFSWDDELREALHPRAPGFVYRDTAFRRLYLCVARWLARPSGRDLFAGEDRLVAVSPWVAETMQRRHGVACDVIHSPVPGSFPRRSLAEREHSFVCLGRLSPEKRIEEVVSILERVRARGHVLRLHVVGGGEDTPYTRALGRLVAERSNWVTMEGRLHGSDKVEVLAGRRFGLHACRGDAFPGALVEMMKAGCIPWAHRSGGQVAILEDDALLYGDADEAVEKIDRTLRDPALQQRLHEDVLRRSERYAVERFVREIRALVRDWAGARGLRPGRVDGHGALPTRSPSAETS